MVCVFGGACRRSRSSLWLLEVSQLTKNVSWQSLSVASQAAIQILMMSVFARHVSPHEFGILAVANIYLAFVTLFSTDGISAFLVHEEELKDETVGLVFVVSTLVASLLLALSWLLAGHIAMFFESKNSALFIKVLSFILVVNAVTLPLEALKQRSKNFSFIAKVNICSFIFGYFLIGLIGVFANWGIWAIVSATVGQSLTKFFLFIVLSNPHLSNKNIKMGPAMHKLKSFALSMTSIKLLQYFSVNIDRMVAGKKLGVEDLGIYQMYNQIITLPSRYVGNITDTAIFSHMARLRNDPVKAKSIHVTSLQNVFIIIFPAVILLSYFSTEFIGIFLGVDWLIHSTVFSVLVVSVVFRLLYRINNSAIRAFGDLKNSLLVNVLFLLLLVAGLFFFSDRGLAYIALVITVSFAFASMMQIVIMNRYMRWDSKDLVRSVKLPFFSSGCSMLSILVVEMVGLHSPFSIIVTALTFFMLFFYVITFLLRGEFKPTLVGKIFSKLGVWNE